MAFEILDVEDAAHDLDVDEGEEEGAGFWVHDEEDYWAEEEEWMEEEEDF